MRLPHKFYVIKEHGVGLVFRVLEISCAPKGGTGLQPLPPQKTKFKKKTDFVDTMISKVLSELPFSRNKPLKSANEQYIRILKSKIKKLANLT